MAINSVSSSNSSMIQAEQRKLAQAQQPQTDRQAQDAQQSRQAQQAQVAREQQANQEKLQLQQDRQSQAASQQNTPPKTGNTIGGNVNTTA